MTETDTSATRLAKAQEARDIIRKATRSMPYRLGRYVSQHVPDNFKPEGYLTVRPPEIHRGFVVYVYVSERSADEPRVFEIAKTGELPVFLNVENDDEAIARLTEYLVAQVEPLERRGAERRGS